MDLLDKWKKIGIITFQNAINYGAVLQCYALQTFIKQNNIDCEVIDYQCDKLKKDYRNFKIYDKSLKGFIVSCAKIPFNYGKKRKFLEFRKKNINLSQKKYNSKNIATANDIYGTFITGSDQVWNLQLTNYDVNYFLDFANQSKLCYSYAASIGKAKASDKELNIIKKQLEKFNKISVREKNLKEQLSKINDKEIVKVLDPVFLIENNQWKQLAIKPKIKKYVLVYALHETMCYKVAQKLAALLNLEIVCLQSNFKKPIKAKYVFDAGINEFLGYMENAKYVVTDSFHGVAFSLIFKRNLKFVLKQDLKGLNDRLESLAEEFDLNEAIVNVESSGEKLIEETNYKEIDNRIQNSVIYSKKYLKEILETQD